jgi:hypothetical protein
MLITINIAMCNCGTRDGSQYNGVFNGIKVVISMPMLFDETGVKNELDSFYIFKTDKYVIYKTPYLYTNNNIQVDKAGNVIRQTAEPSIKFSYFVYDTSAKRGVKFDSLTARTGHVLSIDSFETNFGIKTFALPDDFLVNNRLIVTHRSDEIQSVYATIDTSDIFNNDSMYLYFSTRFNNAPVSFSNAADKFFNTRLYKICYVYNNKFDKKRSITLPHRILWISMRPLDDAGPTNVELKSILHSFESENVD